MRLWHEKLIPYLPRQQLLGQHRECCALRGAGWGKPHATVNYVFKHPKEWLYCYHVKVMAEMIKRGYHPDLIWLDMSYQGCNMPSIKYTKDNAPDVRVLNKKLESIVYPEHDYQYLMACIKNLEKKGVTIDFSYKSRMEEISHV